MINLGQGNPDQPTYDHIVEALCLSAKNLPAISIHSLRQSSFLRKQLLVFTRNIMGLIYLECEICVMVELNWTSGIAPSFDESWRPSALN